MESLNERIGAALERRRLAAAKPEPQGKRRKCKRRRERRREVLSARIDEAMRQRADGARQVRLMIVRAAVRRTLELAVLWSVPDPLKPIGSAAIAAAVKRAL